MTALPSEPVTTDMQLCAIIARKSDGTAIILQADANGALSVSGTITATVDESTLATSAKQDTAQATLAALLAAADGGTPVTQTDVTSGDTAQTATASAPAASHHLVVTDFEGSAIGADFKVELKDGSTVIKTLYGKDGQTAGLSGCRIAITSATAASVVVTKLSGTTTHITANLTTVTVAD